jgi:predicted metal-dependent hydrolase
MAIINHKIFGKVECVRSWRARSIRLKVCGDLSIKLTYPLFCTRSRAIEFMESKRAWIEATRQRIGGVPSVSATDMAQLRKAARQYLPATLERLAREHGFKYTSVRISSAHTRWGSCSGKNGISLSLFLMLLPEHLREFVILHELCHTRHHNHSAAFHALLDSCVGGKEKLLNKELRSYHIPRVE